MESEEFIFRGGNNTDDFRSTNVTNLSDSLNIFFNVGNTIPLFALLIFFCVATTLGNVLVIVSIIRERGLHSPTNYFIASLASADFLLGTIVMPFQAITELLNKRWIFGGLWCDIWHALDVLLATASILNLCVISLDRYWAISEPFSYPTKMTPKMSMRLIGGVWICASLISLPAILWWRATRVAPFPEDLCLFTDDVVYLVASSCISFYFPLIVMLFTYFKIYRAAVRQTRSIKMGTKLFYDKDLEVKLRMRVHRGGLGARDSLFPTSANFEDLGHLSISSPSIMALQQQNNRRKYSISESGGTNSAPFINAVNMALSPTSMAKFNLKTISRGSILKRKLSKFAKEKKAAKTLAIVLGVFILCWMPFFVVNLAAAFCSSCFFQQKIIFDVVTWLGWVNSGMNPFIYAAWNRDFRKAFGRILCFSPCCKFHSKFHLPRGFLRK